MKVLQDLIDKIWPDICSSKVCSYLVCKIIKPIVLRYNIEFQE